MLTSEVSWELRAVLVGFDDAMLIHMYSDDLRCRIVWQHYFLDVAAEKVAEVMQVSMHPVYRYAERFQVTGEVCKCFSETVLFPCCSIMKSFISCIYR